MIRITRSLILASLLLLSGACSGGSAPFDAPDSTSTDSTPENDGSGANMGMTGMLVTSVKSRLWKVDLYTGKVTWHGDTYFPDDGDEQFYYPLAGFQTSPSYSSEGGFVVGVSGCLKKNILTSCVTFYDKTPKLTRRFVLNDRSFGAKESWDRKYVAIQSRKTLDNAIYILSNDDLSTIRRVSIEPLKTLANFKWGPDGKLYYIHEVDPIKQIKYIHPTNPELDGWLDFPMPPGGLLSIRFTHDGKKFLLQHYNSQIGRREVYVGDFLDTSSVRRVVYAGGHAYSRIYNTEWTADGKWIIFQLGQYRNGWVEGVAYTNLLAVSADASDVKVDYLDDFENDPSVIRIHTDSWKAFPHRSSNKPRYHLWFGNGVAPLAHY